MEKMRGTTLWNLDKLLLQGKERRRLTAQTMELAGRVAERIAEDLHDSDAVVTLGGYAYHVQEYKSNLDSYFTLAVEDLQQDGRPGALTSKVSTPGGTFHLHRDLNAVVPVAERDEYLAFINHLPEIIRQFGASEQGVIWELRRGFERLKAMAEGGE